MNGLLVSLEGVEGCGKTTQTRLLVEKLSKLGHEVVTLREPGGTLIGEEIRNLLIHSDVNLAMTPEAELLLMTASRAQLVRQVITPALTKGAVVICDRFYDSTIAYQGYGRGMSLAVIRDLIAFAVGDIHPRITILLRVPLELGAARVRSRQALLPKVRDRIGDSDRAFFVRVAEGFNNIAASDQKRIRAIDGTLTIESVNAAILESIRPLLPPQV